jgi:hypothetical protein
VRVAPLCFHFSGVISIHAKFGELSIYVSGYADDVLLDESHGALEKGLAFLQKPYSLLALSWRIREVLGS